MLARGRLTHPHALFLFSTGRQAAHACIVLLRPATACTTSHRSHHAQALLASAQQSAGRGAQRLARLYRVMEALQADMGGPDLDTLADSRTALDLLFRELDVLQASLGQVSLQVSSAGGLRSTPQYKYSSVPHTCAVQPHRAGRKHAQ